MISVETSVKMLTETLPGKQAAMIDALSGEDAKHLLKLAIRVIAGQDVAVDTK